MQRLSGFMRTYWSRGEPGRETPRSLAVFMQRMWLAALAFKLLGSSWDVSWHFKWLRDDLAPPHIVNTVGTGIAIGLVLAHTFTGYGVEKRSLRLMQWGTGIFVVAGPIDVINHRINGLDLTSWSPSHLLLYFGTFIMIMGVIRNWYRTYPSDGKFRWQWTAGLTALFAFLFEDAFFPQLQQEYGILEVASWFRGAPYAEPSLLSFAANQIGRPVDDAAVQHFAMPIPAWVYPVWGIAVCVAILVFARLMVGFRWTATCAVGGYLVYRLAIWPLLVVGGFPPSSPPLWLLPVALAVDLLFLVRMNEYLRAVVGAVVVTAVGFGSLLVHALALGSPLTLADDDIVALRAAWAAGDGLNTPPIAWWSWWIAGIGLLVTWAAVVWLASRTIGLGTQRPPEISVQFGPEPRRSDKGVLLGWDEPAPSATESAGRTSID